MNQTEATSNIIVAMINNHFISNPTDISAAYKIVFEAVSNPYNN